MEYGPDAKFSFWKRLTSGGFGQRKKEPLNSLGDDHVTRSQSVDRNLNLAHRGNPDNTTRWGGDQAEHHSTGQTGRHPPSSRLTSQQEPDLSGVRYRPARPGGLQANYRRYSDCNARKTERSEREGSYPQDLATSRGLVSTTVPLLRDSTDYSSSSKRTSVELTGITCSTTGSSTTTTTKTGSGPGVSTDRRSSLQFYYDPGKYSTPSTEKDFSGVRSIYTRTLSNANDTISGSGRRAVITSSSSYRPLVYTPGSPSPLRCSWTSTTDTSQADKMASFMAIGRNSVFPDFLSSRGSNSQHGNATPAYQENNHESGLEGLKQKTLRLFGNNNNSQKSSSAKSNSSPTSSNKSFYRSNSQSGEQKPGSNGNGNGTSRNIYRQPSSISNHRSSSSRNQTADLRRKYFSQRMMWYSEADEDQVEPDFDRNFEKRHHSALELGSVSHADLLRSDSVQSSSTSSQESIDRDRPLNTRRSRALVLKTQSLDYYDNMDYRDTRGFRETSSASMKSRRSSGSGGSSLRLSRAGTLQRQRSKSQRTRFSDEVAVVYYDQEENPTALSNCDTIHQQEKLKDDKTSSSTVTEGTIRLACTLHPGQSCGQSNLARILASSSLTEAQETQNDNNDKNTTMASASDKIAALAVTDNIDAEGNMVRKSVFAEKSFEIVETDESHELKLVVPIGSQFIRNRTSVKATSGGKRLIVIAYRNEGDGDMAHVHQYIEKMTLPHPIDAYSVRATMDRDGNLKISAPMSITSEQNNAIARASENR